MRGILAVVCFVLILTPLAAAQEVPFKKYNPDIAKYEFAKSFIAGLSYYNRLADRLVQEEKIAVNAQSDVKEIEALITNRTLDNTELRIAKNYLVKFQSSPNGLIRQIVRDTVVVYDRLLAVSVHERELWQSFASSKTSDAPGDFNEEDFGQQQLALAQEKKEVAKDLIRQSVFASKALLSAKRCSSEACRELALTQNERDKLVRKLDAFAKGSLDWGLKSGQSTVKACVAVLREVLEDPLYQSQP